MGCCDQQNKKVVPVGGVVSGVGYAPGIDVAVIAIVGLVSNGSHGDAGVVGMILAEPGGTRALGDCLEFL